jgi:hypothetical protein
MGTDFFDSVRPRGRRLRRDPDRVAVAPHPYGLVAAGEAGVRHCIDILAGELRMTMQLCGARRLSELTPGLIRRRQP